MMREETEKKMRRKQSKKRTNARVAKERRK
jgi:hypothetical protein